MKKATRMTSFFFMIYCLLMAISYFYYAKNYFDAASNIETISSLAEQLDITASEAQSFYFLYAIVYLVAGILSALASPICYVCFVLAGIEPVPQKWKFVLVGVISIVLTAIIPGVLTLVYGVQSGSKGHGSETKTPRKPDSVDDGKNPYDYQY